MTARGWTLRWGVSAATALFAAACHPVQRHVHYIGPETGFMKVNTRLDCPETSGDLMRSGVAADGMSCTYTGPNDETVSLQLTPLAGAAPQAVLTRFETQLKGDAGLADVAPPTPPPPPAPPKASAKAWDAGAAKHSDDDDDKDDDDKSDTAASADDSDGGHTKIDLPGVHIATDGDKADVQLPGLSIHANGDNAQVQAGWWGHKATIESHDGATTIRVGHADGSGVDAMLILTSDSPGPAGYRAVGYVAKGPPAGPLVIATFKTKSENHSQHNLAGDGTKKLVQLNVHQGFGWFSDAAAGDDKDAKP